MPEETQAGPCAELTKALEACLAENVSLTMDYPPRIILRELSDMVKNAFSLGRT